MYDIFQEQQERRIVRNFMPNLLEQGHYIGIGKLIKGNSDRRLKEIVLQVFMKGWLLTRMQKSYQDRYI